MKEFQIKINDNQQSHKSMRIINGLRPAARMVGHGGKEMNQKKPFSLYHTTLQLKPHQTIFL